MTNRLKVISRIFSALILLAILAGLVMANIFYISHNPVEKKFLIPWLGMRTFLEIGSDPYAESATQRTQLLFYGNLAESTQDPLKLSQPYTSLILYLPLALITDYTTARVVWMLILELLLIASVFLNLNLFDWKIPIFVTLAYSILAVFGTQALFPLFQNDQVILVHIFLLIGLIGLQRGFEELSGVAFVLALFQPTVTGILCLMIFWWAFHNRRLRVIWGGMMTLGFLILISFGLFPGWFLPFVQSYRSAFDFLNYQSTFLILSDLWPAIGSKVAALLTLGISINLILEWRAAANKDFRWFLWIASFTIAACPLLGIPTLEVNNIVFLIPLTFILKVISERMGRRKNWLLIVIIIGFIFMGGWTITLGLQNFVNPEAYKMITFFIPPLLLIVGLYWIRWWAIRPPRTWMDTIDREQR